MGLPTSKSTVDNNLSDQVILVYGRPKIGKSTFCSYFDDALFLATEPGLNHLEVYKQNVTSWESFLSACADIKAGNHKFKTIVIDTIDNLVGHCTEYICKREDINHPSDYEYGKGWSMVTMELSSKLNKLSLLGYGLIMVGHNKVEELKTKTSKINRHTLTVTGENRKVVLSMADIVLYMDSDVKDGEEVGVIRTKPSMYYEAGDKSKLLPELIEFPLSQPKVAYDTILKSFNKQGGK